MPQLDINSFLPIVYWLCLSFSFCFIFIYLTFFFVFINTKKIKIIYKTHLYLQTLYYLSVLKNDCSLKQLVSAVDVNINNLK